MTASGLFILGVLAANVWLAEWLARKTFLRHAGSALLVIVQTAVVANLGIIPASAEQAPIYDGIFDYVAPMAVFLLLLNVNLKDVLKAGTPMILLFLVGAVATMIGIVLAMWMIDGSRTIGESHAAIGGIFTGTYIGGSVNFNAIALHYGVMKQGTLFAGAVAVDNIVTTLWMVVCLAVPKLFRKSDIPLNEIATAEEKPEKLVIPDLAVLIAAGTFSIWISNWLAGALGVPSILVLTTIALGLAQIPRISALQGSGTLGMFGLLLFLAVIGAFCDLSALRTIGQLGVSLLLLASITVLIHGIVVFGVGKLFRADMGLAAIASQANIGGPASAIAVARSLGRQDLVLPAVLVGMLGYALGSYAGFWVAEFWLKAG